MSKEFVDIIQTLHLIIKEIAYITMTVIAIYLMIQVITGKIKINISIEKQGKIK